MVFNRALEHARIPLELWWHVLLQVVLDVVPFEIGLLILGLCVGDIWENRKSGNSADFSKKNELVTLWSHFKD